MIQQTSIKAFYSLNDLGDRQVSVLEAFLKLGSACNLEIANYLGKPINSITPRTNELVAAGLVTEDCKKITPLTGRTVIFWKLTNEGKRIFERLL